MQLRPAISLNTHPLFTWEKCTAMSCITIGEQIDVINQNSSKSPNTSSHNKWLQPTQDVQNQKTIPLWQIKAVFYDKYRCFIQLKTFKTTNNNKIRNSQFPRKCSFLHSLLVKVFDENILVSILLCFNCRFANMAYSSSQVKLSFIVIPLHVGTYSGTKCHASQDHGAT